MLAGPGGTVAAWGLSLALGQLAGASPANAIYVFIWFHLGCVPGMFTNVYILLQYRALFCWRRPFISIHPEPGSVSLFYRLFNEMGSYSAPL